MTPDELRTLALATRHRPERIAELADAVLAFLERRPATDDDRLVLIVAEVGSIRGAERVLRAGASVPPEIAAEVIALRRRGPLSATTIRRRLSRVRQIAPKLED